MQPGYQTGAVTAAAHIVDVVQREAYVSAAHHSPCRTVIACRPGPNLYRWSRCAWSHSASKAGQPPTPENDAVPSLPEPAASTSPTRPETPSVTASTTASWTHWPADEPTGLPIKSWLAKLTSVSAHYGLSWIPGQSPP